ncbi:hypothetical protein BX666DRAFT_203400 [Dichotomocladium elegans]|nr:hypothetical protein BX666DRAFT_203400 [Dichotomocladium elegans]
MATQENTPGSSADRPRPTTAGTAARPCGTTQRHRPESPQPATSFFLRAIRPAHVNLRNHLSHFDTILSPPLLRRQNAVLEDMPSSSEDEDKFSIKPMPIYPAGAAEKRRCRICFSETEENGKFIVPCKCIGPIRYVHDNCFEDWLASSISPGECSTCNEPFSFSVTNHTCYDKDGLFWAPLSSL